MPVRATSITRITGATTSILATGSYVICSILCANKSDSAELELDFQTQAGTDLFTIVVPPDDTEDITVPFMLDGGLKVAVAPGSDGFVTVFHSATGA